MCCLGSSTVLVVLGLIVGYIVWLVYSIIALTEVSDSTIHKNCGSLLWRYVLTMCIMLGTSHYSATPNKDNTDKTSLHALVIVLLIFSGMASWGSYELWGRDCSYDLRDYKIYTMAYIVVVYQWTIVGICSLALGGLFLYHMLCR